MYLATLLAVVARQPPRRCKADQRPRRAMVIVIYRPTGLVVKGDRGPVRCRLRPERRIHLLTTGYPRRITLRGSRGCAVWAQPQPSRDPPSSLWPDADADAGLHECPSGLWCPRRLGDVVLGWMMAGGEWVQFLRLLIGQVWRLARIRSRASGLPTQLDNHPLAGERRRSVQPELSVRDVRAWRAQTSASRPGYGSSPVPHQALLTVWPGASE